jgi:hypothetical protein
MNINLLLDEMDKLITLLDEDINLAYQQIVFKKESKKSKDRFIDENIRPVIYRKLLKQTERVLKILNEYENKHEQH